MTHAVLSRVVQEKTCVREKWTPHYVLSDVIRAWQRQGDIKTTRRIQRFLRGELQLIDAEQRLHFISAIQRGDFVKSLCHWDDHRVWQDVYVLTYTTRYGYSRRLYLKLTVTKFGGPYLLIQAKDELH